VSVFIAVLRAVNVGGASKLPMKELKAACEAAGLAKVATYIASGNLVFEHEGSADEAKAIIAGVLHDGFGLARNHTIIRTPAALAGALEANPFPDAALARPHHYLLHFLEAVPPAGVSEALAAWTGPERLHLAGDHLYVDFAVGVAASKLTPAKLERLLQVAGTARNWNTSRKLLEMAQR
jgi:uncharacterized protein (DUF1697 family)